VETRYAGVTIIMAVIAVSGCSAIPIPSDSGGGGTTEPEMVPGKGLEVSSFRVSDNTMTPDQTVEVTLELENYHREPIEIGNISLYNLGLLSKSEKECTPDEIQPAREGVPTSMECSWRITAPEEDLVGGFDQRKATIYANIPYDANITNYRPFKIEFRPLDEVNSTSKKSMTYANSEVEVNMETETPIPFEQNKLVNFQVSSVGNGRVDGEYEFGYSPESVFVTQNNGNVDGENVCPESDEPVLEDVLSFSCYVEAEGVQSTVRNLFFTVSYKYVQSPSLSVTIVN
jgi:hypothetical protein